MTSRPEPRTGEVFEPTETGDEYVRYTREFFIDLPDEFWGLIVRKLALTELEGKEKHYFDPMRNEPDE